MMKMKEQINNDLDAQSRSAMSEINAILKNRENYKEDTNGEYSRKHSIKRLEELRQHFSPHKTRDSEMAFRIKSAVADMCNDGMIKLANYPKQRLINRDKRRLVLQGMTVALAIIVPFSILLLNKCSS